MAPWMWIPNSAPKRIRIGLVGTEKSTERFLSWLEQCKNGLDAKVSNKPNLIPRFPGLNEDVGLRTSVVTGKELTRTVHPKHIREVLQIKERNRAIEEATKLFLKNSVFVEFQDDDTKRPCLCTAD